MKFKVLCDFDGTIVVEDISVIVLEHFAEGPWQQYEDMLEAGEITTEQGLPLEFGLVKSSKDQILEKIKDLIVIRNGFEEFVQFCKNQDMELIIVSAGLDFVIEYAQSLIGTNLSVVSPHTIFGDSISFTFPSRYYPDSEDFKSDLVKHYQSIGNKVIFVGDGGSDFQGGKYADYVFAVEDQSLSKYLLSLSKNEMYEFNSFHEIAIQVSKIIDGVSD